MKLKTAAYILGGFGAGAFLMNSAKNVANEKSLSNSINKVAKELNLEKTDIKTIKDLTHYSYFKGQQAAIDSIKKAR